MLLCSMTVTQQLFIFTASSTIPSTLFSLYLIPQVMLGLQFGCFFFYPLSQGSFQKFASASPSLTCKVKDGLVLILHICFYLCELWTLFLDHCLRCPAGLSSETETEPWSKLANETFRKLQLREKRPHPVCGCSLRLSLVQPFECFLYCCNILSVEDKKMFDVWLQSLNRSVNHFEAIL